MNKKSSSKSPTVNDNHPLVAKNNSNSHIKTNESDAGNNDNNSYEISKGNAGNQANNIASDNDKSQDAVVLTY